MEKKKITRKELLKKDDEFISFSNRFFQYISTHTKQLQYLIISLMIIIAAIIGISIYFKHVNKKALAAYNLAYTNLVSGSASDIKKDAMNKSIKELDRIIKKYGWTKMATLAIPQLAYLKFGQEKYDEAISLYKTYLKKTESTSLYHAMAYFGLAAAHEAKSDHQSAIQYLKKILDDKNNFLKEEATFSLGRLYALNGQKKLSEETFKDFSNKYKGSPLLPLAKANAAK